MVLEAGNGRCEQGWERAQFPAGWLCRDAVAEGCWMRFGNCVGTVQVKEVHKGEYPNFFLSLLLVVS